VTSAPLSAGPRYQPETQASTHWTSTSLDIPPAPLRSAPSAASAAGTALSCSPTTHRTNS